MKESTSSIPEITFENMPKTLAKVCDEIISLRNEMVELKVSFQPKEPVEYMTRKEVAEMLKCDESTVHKWTVKKKLIKHCLGHRAYYMRSEVQAALVAIK